ncbi:Ku protein [Ruminiclostridium cellulolyticum]|uniref:Non-homologous end joining protein Ku n=1 Tax=Ruminiclostridium cellulolyticum (strain ATCC 35319 / DSM 5812 / JCM 6584 / H10) TaxID=394503 RepID=B8I5T2_RUMCH|nr:Ku protein [Ruminiclostridium cellulolyticum]ACL74749.1 Ku protein [Ruminiclostridium cellulolyticum H10]
MHTVWKGSISFGLVNIPVKMFTATEDKDIRFKYIHKECHSPVKYKKVCPVCNKEVQPEDIVRGFEYEPGKYVIMTGEDFESLQVKSEKTVEIIDFVKLEEVDPVYFDKTYFLAPQETGGKAYTLLREALGQKEKIAVSKITIRDRESLAVIRVYKNVLVLETIFYPDEVKDSAQVPGIPEATKTTPAELDMATQLIDNLTTAFDPSKYVDTYREKLVELINAKVEGKQVVARKEVEKENVVSLMEALQRSIQMSKGTNKNEKDKDADKADKSVKNVKNSKKDQVSKVENTKNITTEEKPKKRTRKTREKVES